MGKSNINFCDVFHKAMYADMSFSYSHSMPFRVGSAVDVRNTSLSPRYMIASRSNCSPRDWTESFIITLFELVEQVGGV